MEWAHHVTHTQSPKRGVEKSHFEIAVKRLEISENVNTEHFWGPGVMPKTIVRIVLDLPSLIWGFGESCTIVHYITSQPTNVS